MTEKRPEPSDTAERTFSISAGLATSTVTPGRTAPDVSLTAPAMVLVCAAAASGSTSTNIRPANILAANRCIKQTPCDKTNGWMSRRRRTVPHVRAFVNRKTSAI